MRIKALLTAAAISLITGTAFAAPAGPNIPVGGAMGVCRGTTVYVSAHDRLGNSFCYDDCAVNWPNLMANDGAKHKGAFTLTRRNHGGHQWTHKSWPLHDRDGDAEPGNMKGAGGTDALHVVDNQGLWHRRQDDGRDPSRQRHAEELNGELGMNDTANTHGNTIVLEHTTDIVVAYLSSNAVNSTDLPDLIRGIYAALLLLQQGEMSEPDIGLMPAVPIAKSVTSDYIICLEDGKKFKSLKRHLATHYNLAPEQYREKWNLPQDYPMTAPNYSATRSALAKANGLGRSQAASIARGRGGARKSTT